MATFVSQGKENLHSRLRKKQDAINFFFQYFQKESLLKKNQLYIVPSIFFLCVTQFAFFVCR